MSRQLDINIYLALNGYSLKIIPKERIKYYMSEPHYSTDAVAMLELDREMRKRGWRLQMVDGAAKYSKHGEYEYWFAFAETEPLARALAAYKALTGKEWEGEGE